LAVKALLFAALVLTLLAGCLEEPSTNIVETSTGTEPEALRSWVWNTTETPGPTVVLAEVHGHPETDCKVSVVLAIETAQPHGASSGAILFEWGDGSNRRILLTIGSSTGVHLEGVVDRRGASDGTLVYRGNYDQVPLRGGNLSITLLSDGPVSSEWEPRSMGMAVECSDEIDLSFKGSRDVLILRQATSAEGNGFWAPSPFRVAGTGMLYGETSVLLDGATEGTFDSPQVRLRGDSYGIETGEFSLSGPAGTYGWEMLLSPTSESGEPFDDLQLYEFEGGPGHYRMDLTRVAALYHGFWAALYGLHPVDQLDEVMELPRQQDD
jgi:hypothetical protein